jgi:hypothetical protein
MSRLLLCLMLLATGCSRPHRSQTPARSIEELQRDQAASEARGDLRGALELAEAIKCRRVRARLIALGATPHALPELERAELPALAQDEAVLSLYETRGKLARYLAHGASVKALRPVELARLEPAVIVARDELELGALDGGRLDELLQRLHTLLLEGAALSGVHRLLVLPDGIARLVPVHALVRPTPAGPRYVVQQHAVGYAPCLALARPAGRTASIGRAAVIAPDYAAPHAPHELEGARAEAKQVAARLGTRAVSGREATPERLEAALAEQELVHFAGHGLVDLTGGAPPQLLFPDGHRPVTLRSATSSRIGAALVVLASCTSAYAARFRDGQRLLAETTFVEALLAAGARRVVAASWGVKDRQSAEQMAILYARRGAGAAAALAEAQRDAIARIAPPNPRFWAFYSVYGGW